MSKWDRAVENSDKVAGFGKVALELGRGTLDGYNHDKVPRLAAALAFYTVFSLAPVLLIAVAGAGFIYGEQAAQGQLFNSLSGLIGNDAAGTIQGILENMRKPGAGIVATIIGLVTLLLGATGVFAELQDSLNTIWGVQPKPKRALRTIVGERFASFLMVLGIALLLLISLLISTVLSALTGILGDRLSGFLTAPLDLVISFGITAVLFALVYKVLPDVQIGWKDVALGAGLTAVLFIVGKSLIGLYLGRSGISSTYGAAGSFALLLLWVFYSAQIFFIGAEFTKVFARWRGRAIQPGKNATSVEQLVG